MLTLKKNHCAWLLLSILSATPVNPLLAAQREANGVTLFETRIAFNQSTELDLLLKKAPEWEKETIHELFSWYLRPIVTASKNDKNNVKYNARFINAYWGPLQNPFNKYPRPAKIFVFPGNQSTSFYMAPIVRNAVDKQYYVFTLESKSPMLLNDWIQSIQRKEGNAANITINICDKYATDPDDVCGSPTYAHEIEVTYGSMSSYKEPGMPSAYRAANTDWQTMVSHNKSFGLTATDSIYSEAVSWSDVEARNAVLKQTNAWSNYQVIQDNFKKIRDARFFTDNVRNNFLRRISWLYPDDGCWTRAAVAVKGFFGPLAGNPVNDFARPARVFAFGNLCVNTDNEASGAVTWWYHTAPIIKDQQTGETYVLDPAVNPQKALPLATWVAKIGANDGVCRNRAAGNGVSQINVCHGYGVGPGSDCKKASFSEEAQQSIRQDYYLSLERSRQSSLGRNADAVLGDTPPWL